MRPSMLARGVPAPDGEPRPSPVAVVIADDLTGANATGVLLVERGYRALSLLRADGPVLESASRWLADVQRAPAAFILDIASRTVPPQEAARRVRDGLEAIASHVELSPIVSKRIDSTLRGNVGAEVQAAVEWLGAGAFAVVTPAYPASGRIVVGGYLLVDGVPVTRTGAGRDPLSPVRSSHVPTLLRAQQPWPVGHVELSVTLRGAEAVQQALVDEVRAGRRLVVVDAVSDEDVRAVARAVVGASRSLGVPAVCADPGPLTAQALELWGWGEGVSPERVAVEGAAADPTGVLQRTAPGPVIVVAGSTTELTARQLEALEQALGLRLELVDVGALAGQRDQACGAQSRRAWEIERLASSILAHWSRPCVGIRTSRGPDDLAPGLTARQQADLLDGLGLAVRLALRRAAEESRPAPAGLYTTGGDVTAAVLRALDATAIELLDQVLPLAALGQLVGGPSRGLRLVTKGGLVGGEDAAIRCVRRLRGEA